MASTPYPADGIEVDKNAPIRVDAEFVEGTPPSAVIVVSDFLTFSNGTSTEVPIYYDSDDGTELTHTFPPHTNAAISRRAIKMQGFVGQDSSTGRPLFLFTDEGLPGEVAEAFASQSPEGVVGFCTLHIIREEGRRHRARKR
jgi:hypothetical protein